MTFNKPIILIDGRHAQGEQTGVGRYTYSILRHWPVDLCREVLLSSSRPYPATLMGKSRKWSDGPTWHIRAALRVLSHRALYFSPASLIVPAAVGKRSALTVHDLTPLTMPGVHTRRNVIFHRLLFRLALRRTGAIIVPSVAVQRDLLKFIPSSSRKVHVIPEGPREIAPSAALDARRRIEPQSLYVLYVGTIEPRKNVLTLISAFRSVAPHGWHLIMAGRFGWMSADEAQEFQERCEADNVTYRGYVDDDTLAALYRNATVFCYPSESEGFGLPVLEAMQYGVPVIHSDADALVEVAGGAGLCVRRSKLEEELRSAFRFLCSAGDARTRFGEAGRVRAQRFSWAQAARSTADVVSSLGSTYPSSTLRR